jgi:hypothetical protein
VLIKKPGRMRWDYSAPEKKLFVADGVRIYSYIPEDKQVVVSPQPHDAETTTPALFLAGKGNLTRDFTPSLVDNPAGTPSSQSAGGTRQLDYIGWCSRLIATGHPGPPTMDAGWRIDSIFTNRKENTGLADKGSRSISPKVMSLLIPRANAGHALGCPCRRALAFAASTACTWDAKPVRRTRPRSRRIHQGAPPKPRRRDAHRAPGVGESPAAPPPSATGSSEALVD